MVSTPRVRKSDKSTSMRAWRRGPSGPRGSASVCLTGWMRQLERMGNSSPKEISVTRMSERKEGFWEELRMVVSEVRMASSSWASVRN